MMSPEGEKNKCRCWQSLAESKAAGIILRVIYAAVILLTLGIATGTQLHTDDPLLIKIGLGTALVGFSIIALQVILGSRIKMLDRAFGLDKVMMFHRKMGVVAAVLLLSHPVLIAMGHGSLKLFTSHTPWQVNLGKGALILVVLGVLLALSFAKFRMDYNIWRWFHKAMVAAVILAFAHSLVIGDAFEINWIKAWWWVLLIGACGAFLRQNICVRLFGRRAFIVKSVKHETHDTFTLEFVPAKDNVFDYKPGQFMFLKMRLQGRIGEEHPFTISSSPTTRGHITATIKKSGNYTSLIDQPKVMDLVLVQAPFGRFSYCFDNPPSFLFIAAGVGITPIHSMITALRDAADFRDVILLYGNKTEQDIIFRGEFEKLPANFKVVHVLSRADKKWKGLTGHINAEIIKQQAGDILDRAHIYVCGPSMMMQSIIVALKTIGVDNERIHRERFTI
jgi:predicted ferric reductase